MRSTRDAWTRIPSTRTDFKKNKNKNTLRLKKLTKKVETNQSQELQVRCCCLQTVDCLNTNKDKLLNKA